MRYSSDAVYGQYNHSTNDVSWWRIDEGTIGALKIVVDGTHNIFYPIPYPTSTGNQQILKFSPHFDSLIDAVYVFDSALTYTINSPNVIAFEMDAQNNLYINMEGLHFPGRVPIANSNNSLHLGDSALRTTWVLKYNSNLEATGLVQLSYGTATRPPQMLLLFPYIDNSTNSLFIPGLVGWTENVDHIFYNNDTLDLPNETIFWLRLDLDDLHLLSYGRALTGEDCKGGAPRIAASNNRVHAQFHFLYSLIWGDSTIYAPYSNWDIAYAAWDYDGREIGIFSRYNTGYQGNIYSDIHALDSTVYLTGSIWENATFGDTTITHNQNASRVYIAKYVDPEFAHPYVHPSGRQEQSIIWQQELSFHLTDSPILLTANATSGLPIPYTCNDSSIAYSDGSMLYLLRNGTTTVTASQQGDSDYLPAEPVTKTLQVNDVGTDALANSSPHIFPNPVSDALFVIPNGEPITAVRLLSSLGRQQQVTLSNNKINLSHLPAGVYFLSITTTSNNYQFKILKK